MGCIYALAQGEKHFEDNREILRLPNETAWRNAFFRVELNSTSPYFYALQKT